MIMNKRIFLLEDDPGVRDVLQLILELEDYEVTSFETVEKFMSHLPEVKPDLFILDVMLPDGNGFEVCKELKESTMQTPVLMMSAHATAKNSQEACTADAFISKPFDMNNLLQTVGTLVKRN